MPTEIEVKKGNYTLDEVREYVLLNKERIKSWKALRDVFPDVYSGILSRALNDANNILEFYEKNGLELETDYKQIPISFMKGQNNKEAHSIKLEQIREFIKLNKVHSWQELKHDFPNTPASHLSRAFNQVFHTASKSEDSLIIDNLCEKNKVKELPVKNRLKTFFNGILKRINEKEISSFIRIVSYLEVDSGIELVNGELESLRTSIARLPGFKINGDEIRKVQVKKTIKTNGEIKSLLQRTELILTKVKDQQQSFIQFKKTSLDVYSPINRALSDIKTDVRDLKKDVIDKVIAVKNDIFDLRKEVKYNQERINELISVCYNAINTNPNLRFRKK